MTQEVTSCSGAPRDLGFEQGRVHRNQLRNGVEQAGLRTLRRRLPTLRAWSSGPVLGECQNRHEHGHENGQYSHGNNNLQDGISTTPLSFHDDKLVFWHYHFHCYGPSIEDFTTLSVRTHSPKSGSHRHPKISLRAALTGYGSGSLGVSIIGDGTPAYKP